MRQCIILSNLATSFTRPSIIDIKLGTVLYDASDASISEEKRRKMEEKMRVRSSVRTGAAITGFQVRSLSFWVRGRKANGEDWR